MFLFSLEPFQIFAWIVSFLLGLTVHEAAHAAAATYLGDPTARLAGRLTLNPLAHLDLAGTLFLLFVGFGWGKPVPVHPGNFRDQAAGSVLVSVAGPLSNLVLALLLALPYNFLLTTGSAAWELVQTMLYVNVVLLVFNLLPVYPLDGGNAIAPLLPPDAQIQFRQFGPLVLFSIIGIDFVFKTSILWSLLSPLIQIVWAVINLATRFGS